MMTVDEAKALAEENEYDTEPNDEGEIEKRPGKLSDYIPSPYKNDEAGRAANNGALPPDLSLITKARHGGCDYIFSLLTGYPEEPPAGAVVPSGLNFNPYFPGTGIAMARVLYDGLVEYEDGTPATTSQMAKDVVEFLNWSAEPEMDERKRMGWKVMAIGSVLFAISVWMKRYVFRNCEHEMFHERHANNQLQVQVVHHQDQTHLVQPSRQPRQDEPPPDPPLNFSDLIKRRICCYRCDKKGRLMAGVGRVESACTVYLSALPLFVSNVVVSEILLLESVLLNEEQSTFTKIHQLFVVHISNTPGGTASVHIYLHANLVLSKIAKMALEFKYHIHN